LILKAQGGMLKAPKTTSFHVGPAGVPFFMWKLGNRMKWSTNYLPPPDEV